MQTFILVVIMQVYAGSDVNFQEFTTLKNCNHAKNTIYEESKRVGANLRTAYCVAK